MLQILGPASTSVQLSPPPSVSSLSLHILVPASEFPCRPLPGLLPFSVYTLLVPETPPNSGTSADRAVSIRWASLSLSVPFCKDLLEVFPVFALCPGQAPPCTCGILTQLLGEDRAQRQTRREDASGLPAGANLSGAHVAGGPQQYPLRWAAERRSRRSREPAMCSPHLNPFSPHCDPMGWR